MSSSIRHPATVESSVLLRESYIEWVPEDTFAIVVLRVSQIKSPPKVLWYSSGFGGKAQKDIYKTEDQAGMTRGH